MPSLPSSPPNTSSSTASRKNGRLQCTRGRYSSLSAHFFIQKPSVQSFVSSLSITFHLRQIVRLTPPCFGSLSAGIKDLAMRGMLNSATLAALAADLVPALPVQHLTTLLQVAADPQDPHVSTGALAQSGQQRACSRQTTVDTSVLSTATQ
jgi:hypothetical protein